MPEEKIQISEVLQHKAISILTKKPRAGKTYGFIFLTLAGINYILI